MTALEYIHYDNAEELLARIRRSNDVWWDNCGGASSWFFRGVGDADHWRLISSAWRSIENQLQPLIDKIKSAKLEMFSDEDSIIRRHHEWIAAEQEALFQFAALANEVGFKVNSANYSTQRSPFTTKTIGLPLNVRENAAFLDKEFMCLAQHHGIPTRLLDWSANPLVAAFFAASPLCRAKNAKQVCIWALDINQTKQPNGDPCHFGPYSLVAHTPSRSENRYLHSQGGVLTELNAKDNFYEYFHKNQARPALEDILEGIEVVAPVLIGHTLDCVNVPHLLTLLDREGVNSAVLMPTLDNVSKTVIARWNDET